MIAAFLFLQPGFQQECRKVTICNETTSEIINENKSDTRNAGNAIPERNKWETESKRIKGEKGSQGEFCNVGASVTNNKIAGSLVIVAAK